MDKEILLLNIDKIHTTIKGIERIKHNLRLNDLNVIDYCKTLITNKNSIIYNKGKNWYCEVNNIKTTINIYSYTIITAHITK